MNIEINLLPDELRPRPPVEMRTLLFIVLIVVLAAGCAFLVQAKISTSSEIADMETRIAEINQEIVSVSSNPEAVALTESIKDLKEMKQSYDSFVASRISWGSALERVEAHATSVDKISELTQSGNTLKIEGTASGYSAVTSYGRSLDWDSKLTLSGMPSLTGTKYSLIVKVAPGGGG